MEMKKLQNELKSIMCHQDLENRHIEQDFSAPVHFNSGQFDKSHEQNSAQEALHFIICDFFPVMDS